MKTLHFVLVNKLDLLHNELLAAIPSLWPVPAATLLGPGLEAVMQISGDDTQVWLTVPDATDEVAIGSVITAHNPAILTAGEARAARYQVLKGKGAWTPAELEESVRLLLR